MKSYLDTLECLGYAMPNELGVSLILNSLNKDYYQFVQNYNMHSMVNTLAELHAMLKLYEKGISKKVETPVVLPIREGKIQKDRKKPQGAKGKAKGKNKLAYAPKTKIPPPPKRDNSAKDSICHHCKEVGHYRRNCPSYHAELKKKKNASEASTSGSRMLKHGALSLYMGNGMRAAVEAIRSFDLILPSGLIIVLDNCHFAPTVTRGVVSISRLVKNGYPKKTMGYYFYYPLENKIFVSQNAEFFENSFMVQEASGSHGLLELSGSDKGPEMIQEEDAQPFKNTSKEHNEVAPIEYELGYLDEPPNYKVELANPESDKWLEAMNTKMQSMKDNKVWILVELPPNGRTIRSKWLLKKKT
ncbi:zinc finger, CCHC-type containing protein [Tanacetum coccineum]